MCDGSALLVLQPRERNQEQRPEQNAQERADPRDRHEVRGHSQASPDGAKRAVMFHANSPEEVSNRGEDNVSEDEGKVVREVRAAVAQRLAVLPDRARVVVAVSGGPDSMALLDAMAACAADRIALVATFDHRAGAHGPVGVELVQRAAASLGVPCLSGAAVEPMPLATEGEWRAARWQFLRRAMEESGASAVATGHTADDQLETVCMRLLRGAGPRGLAGLDIDGPVVRPLLAVRRATVHRYAAAVGLDLLLDPTNADRRALRTRVRLDLLPALEHAAPGFGDWLGGLGARAAAWRRAVEAWAATVPVRRVDTHSIVVPKGTVQELTTDGLAVLWPVLMAQVGIVADRRGTERVSRFTTSGVPGQQIQLAGGGVVCRLREGFLVSGKRPMDDVTP
jgi:tRNA(Ile)-lysidine synthase